MTQKIFTIDLRDVYARIEPQPIVKFKGFETRNKITEAQAREALKVSLFESVHFITGNKVISFAYRNMKADNCQDIVTLVVPSLREIYWNNKNLVPGEKHIDINTVIKESFPEFYDIYSYPSVSENTTSDDMAEYQVFGKITPYDVLHISLIDFINTINNQQPITITIPDTAITIILRYEAFDFWDRETQSVINYIDLSKHCNLID